MGRRVERTRCNQQWTEARFNSFVKSQLRSGSRKWAPINQCKKEAWVSRGKYKCADCKKTVSPTIKLNGKRVTNIFVDHIKPIVDPEVGFTTWDDFINRLYCEADNLQCLCKACHDSKSAKERALATKRNK